ncbi:hypothetical protein [Streptomyces sp. NPDC052302]|uniref:hypothetical protein n=1 Tax=unclassified Streptomyces TaxID=2593676 RepID=UPI0037D11AEA
MGSARQWSVARRGWPPPSGPPQKKRRSRGCLWEWEAVDSGGTRLANGTELETAVQPGQTTKGETPTTLKTAQGVKLNITSFNRTRSY